MKKENMRINVIVIFIILFFILFFTLKDDFNQIIEQLSTVNLWWIFVAIILIFIYWISLTKAFHLLIKEFKPKEKFVVIFKIMLITQFFNGITPFSTGGQPMQVIFMKKNGIKTSIATSIIIQNFIIYQLSLITLGTIAILINYFNPLFEEIVLLRNLVILGHIINTGVMLVLFLVSRNVSFNKFVGNFVINFLTKLRIIKEKEKMHFKWNEYIDNFSNGVETLQKNKQVFFKSLIFNFIALITFYSIPLILFYSLGDYTSVSVLEVMVASAYITLIGSFVPIPGGSGGLEFGFLRMFGQFIFSPVLSAAMLLWRFITYYLGIIVGAIVLISYSKRGRDL